jgi:uncharacterized protein YdaT
MPWSLKDALSHTKKAKSPEKKKQWAATANAVLKSSGDEGKAVRVANAAVKKKKK